MAPPTRNTLLAHLTKIAGTPHGRRTFLRRVGTAGAATAMAPLLGCGGDDDPVDRDAGTEPPGDGGTDAGVEPDAGTTADPTPFDVYRGLRDALRASPDHLPARAARLVEEGDPERIFELVRDEILVYPTHFVRMGADEVLHVQLFGPRATLRGGAGSPRDKVELLRELYERAGFEATVVKGRVLAEHEDLRSWLLRPVERRFEPVVDADEVARWLDVLGIDPGAALPDPIDDGRAASDALAAALFPLAEGDLLAWEFDWRWRYEIPLVAVTVGGEVRHACPLIPGAAFGDSRTTTVVPLDAAYETPTVADVRVRLEAATSRAPFERFPIVEGQWPVSELAGRQLLVSLVPGLGMADLLRAELRQVPFFVPTLAVQALDSEEPLTDLAVVGDGISPAGNVIEAAEDGTIRVDGFVVHDPSAPSASAEDVAEITDLTIDPGRFETVSLRFTPRDGDGAPVEGLVASDFEVREDGEALPFLLAANRATPRVYVLIDRSGSMPPEWRTPAMQEAFTSALEADVRAVYPGAIVTLDPRGDSRLWTNLADAAQRNPTTIVYVTDGDVVDARTPEIEAALASGPPAVLAYVGAGGGNRAALEEMAALTGGVVVDAATHSAASAAVLGFLGEQVIPTYTLSYRAPLAGPSTRAVHVRVVGPDVETSGTYDVPAATLQRRLVGLYLTVEAGGSSVTRTLAGIHHLAYGHEPIPEDVADRTTSLLWSDVAIAFEGARPPLSVWLDDVVTARLGLEPLFTALRTGDDEAIVQALADGLPRFEADVAMLQPPLWDAASASRLPFETGLRATLVVEGPRLGARRHGRRLDVLPLGHPSTAIEGAPGVRHEATLRETARLAVAEAAVHRRSTLSLLDGQPLTYVGRGGSTHFASRTELSDDVRARWRQVLREYDPYVKIVPESGDPIAFWAIHRETGALLGVLDDGSGGAETYFAVVELLEETIAVAEYLNRLASGIDAAEGLGVPGLGGITNGISVATAVGQILARLFGVATLIVASLDAYEVPEIMRRDLFATACFALQRLLPSGVYHGIDNVLATLILGEGDTDCIGAGGGG